MVNNAAAEGLMVRGRTGPAYLDRHGEALSRRLDLVFAGLSG